LRLDSDPMTHRDYSAELPNILATMMDVFYRTDAEGKVIIVTPSVQELLGYTSGELLGTPLADLYENPELRTELLHRLQEHGGRYKGFEAALRHKDGSRVWVSSNIQFLYDDNGEVSGVQGMVRDITQHKLTEENLRKSEQKFRAIIDHMLDIYYRTDAEGKLIMASPSCKELLGYSQEELLGTRLSDLYVDPSTREIFMQKLVEQGGKYYGFENSLRRKDGSEIWAVASSQFYFDDAGNIAGVEGIVRDITRRKQMEDALRESEQKQRTIFENMMDTYVRTDRKGIVVMVSPSVEKLLGYTPGEVIGKPLRNFYSIPESRDTFLRLLEESGGHYYGYEVLMSRKDGESIWVLINAQFYHDEEGEVAGVEALGRNISELKEAEEQLLKAKENAEAANSAKTEFLSNMSHELRTPLNAILGFSSLLINYNHEPLPDKVNEFLDNIHDAGLHLSSLIDQILDLAKIEAGKANLDLQPVALDRILDDCARLMRPLAVQHRVKLGFEIYHCQDQGHQVYVSADPLRLRQVMINLVSNAIKYNVENGRTNISCQVADGKVMVSVEDTGIGIPRHQQAEVFMPFTRAHKECNVEGSGIGLAVTQKNLELMGSTIHLDSEPGQGSRFWFELELVEAPALETVSQRPAVELPQSPLNISVLYVEDNPIGMRLMEEVIKTLPGVSFYGATSGEQGYRLAQEVVPNLIFMDINLPDISGIDVMQRLRSQPKTRTIPIIALSASALEEDVQRGLEAGFLHYLRKPCEPDEIIRLVTELATAASVQESLHS
jgi:PAS domain S-box-containing protein